MDAQTAELMARLRMNRIEARIAKLRDGDKDGKAGEKDDGKQPVQPRTMLRHPADKVDPKVANRDPNDWSALRRKGEK